MVRLDGVMGGNARHNGFGSAGVARKIVELYIADANQTLGVCYDGEHVDRRAGVRRTKMNTVAGIRVDTADPVIDLLAHKPDLLLFGMRTMRAEREYDRNIRIQDPGGAEFI